MRQIQIQEIAIWSTPAGDMCQRKIDVIFKDLPDMIGIADDILVVGYDSDGKDHDNTLWKVPKICRQVKLKLNKDKCHFRCTSVPCFGEMISRYGVRPDPWKLKVLGEMPPKTKRNFKHFLELLIIYVYSLLTWQTFVNHSENWHQLKQSWPGMQFSRKYLKKQSQS